MLCSDAHWIVYLHVHQSLKGNPSKIFLGGQGCPFVHQGADTVAQTAKRANPSVTRKNAGSKRRRQRVNNCGTNKVNKLIAPDKTLKNAGNGTKCKATQRIKCGAKFQMFGTGVRSRYH